MRSGEIRENVSGHPVATRCARTCRRTARPLLLPLALWLTVAGGSRPSPAGNSAGAPTPTATDGTAAQAHATSRLACEGPDVDPWVADQRERTLSYSGIARFAVERYGLPTACEGAVTTEFDGVPYGRLVLTFDGGIEYEVETMPIETSVSTLRSTAGGFTDASAVEDAVRSTSADIGLEIDWSVSEETVEGDRTVRRYQDPASGLNASVTFVYLSGALIEARLSMAS